MDGSPRQCPQCGVTVRDGWKFCGKCRAPIPSPRESTGAASVPWAKSARAKTPFETPVAGAARRSCPDCLAAVEEDGGDFCEHCGARLTPAQEAAPQPGGVASVTAREERARATASGDRTLLASTEEIAPPSARTTAAQTAAPAPASNGGGGSARAEQSESAGARPAQSPAGTRAQVAAVTSPATAPLAGDLDELYRDLAPSPAQSASRPTIPPRAFAIGAAALAAAALLSAVLFVSLRRKPAGVESSENNNAPAARQRSQADASPEGMAFIPGAAFQMGRDDGDEYERPAHAVTVQSFYIDKYEVTREQYAAYLRETGAPPPASWKSASVPADEARLPMTGIDWVEANAYARWAHKRLPTEEEWELAARSTDARRYPWGNDWQDGRANAGEHSAGRVVNVGSFPDGKSPYGAFDMIGNAWEWTASDLKEYPGGHFSSKPQGEMKVIRGGSWKDEQDVTATYRGYLLARGSKDYSATGFRCAKDAGGR